MTAYDLVSLAPLVILFFSSLLLLLVQDRHAFSVSFAAIILAGFSLFIATPSLNPLLLPWVRFDFLARFFTLFFLSVAFAALLLARSFFHRFKADTTSYFFLITASTFGAILVGMAADFLVLFLGLEIFSISLYILCAYMKSWLGASESGIKYFIMGSFATAFLLYGIALLYGALGTTNLALVAEGYKGLEGTALTLFFAGTGLITLGFAFKAALVPFQFYAPDVYEGAPMPVTAYLAVGGKGVAFACFTVVFLHYLPVFDPLWKEGVSYSAYLTLVFANLVAIQQQQFRRFFAYSGIAHAGFLLMPFVAGTPEAQSAVLFYLVIYALATFGSFAVFQSLDQGKEGAFLRSATGLYQREPFLACVLALCLLTLAGIPPTAGFFAKFYVLKITFHAGYFFLGSLGLLVSLFSAYYYVRIVSSIFSDKQVETSRVVRLRAADGLALLALAGLVVLAFYPGPLLHVIQ